MDDCLHKRKNGTCEILSEKDGVREFCVNGPCPYDTTLKGDFVRRNNITDRIERHVRRIDDEVYLLSSEDKIFNSALELALEIIGNEPAADVRENVYSSWKIHRFNDGTTYAHCLNCNITQVFYGGKEPTNFCPNCGADMIGESNE